MNLIRSAWYRNLQPAALLLLSLGISAAQTPTHSAQTPGGVKKRIYGAAAAGFSARLYFFIDAFSL